MKGPAVYLGTSRIVPGRPFDHFLSASAGKCQEQDRFRLYIFLYKVKRPILYDPGLAASGPGDNEDRALRTGHRGILGRIEFKLQIVLYAIFHVESPSSVRCTDLDTL